MYVYLNDRIVPASEAKVSVFDHGFLYGDGVYETMRVYDGVIFMLEEHLERLLRSASLIGLDVRKSTGDIEGALFETLSANALSNAYLRLTVSRGPGPVGLDPDLCEEPTFVVIAKEFTKYPARFYDDGITAMISSVRRNLKEALNPQIKSLNFLNNILAKIEARQKNAYEAIMVNAQGDLTEGTISNIFFVRDGVLHTPSIECGILDGITRSLVIDLAMRKGIPVREGAFTPEDLSAASEVFITNTSMEVMPVGKMEGRSYGVGEVSRLLLKEYRRDVTAYVRNRKGESPSLWE